MASQVLTEKQKQWTFVKVFIFARGINVVLKNSSVQIV